MTSVPNPPAAQAPVTEVPVEPEIRVYSHSSIFYWWPVWAAGFIMAFITYSDGTRSAVVPDHPKHHATYDAANHTITLPPDYVLPGNSHSPLGDRMASSKNLA